MFAIVAAVGVSAVYAHKRANGVIMQRMMAMKTTGDRMKALSKMVTGNTVFDASKTKFITITIKKHADGYSQALFEGQHICA